MPIYYTICSDEEVGPEYLVPSREATGNILTRFGMTRLRIEPKTSHSGDANTRTTTRLIQVHKNSSPAYLNFQTHWTYCSSSTTQTGPLTTASPSSRTPSLTHLDTIKGLFMRQLFVDFHSTFNTVVPIRLVAKLCDLSMNSTVCKSTFL